MGDESRSNHSLADDKSKLLNFNKSYCVSMSELDKMEEGRDDDMNLYLKSCKVETGLGSDRLPQGCGN